LANLRDYVAQRIEKALPEQAMTQAHARFAAMEDAEVCEVLSMGAGWGALEAMRRSRCGGNAMPKGMSFPAASIGKEQMPWVALLETGILPEQSALDTPPSWMTDANWTALLEKSLSGGDNAAARLHLGVMKYESFRFEEGIAEWKKSLALDRSPWALRNLAVAEKRKGHIDGAIAYMEEALALEDNRIDKAFTEEYFDLLIAAGRFDEAVAELQQAVEELRGGTSTTPGESGLGDESQPLSAMAARDLRVDDGDQP
jgi:tetratricopeptide (TPR) repeat protein